MENDNRYVPEEIDNLLFEKDYEELTRYEIHSVSEYMTESEYRKARGIIYSSRDYLVDNRNSITPAVDIKEKLIKVYRKKHITAKPFIGILGLLNYPVPVYRFATALVILMAVYFFFDGSHTPDKIILSATDTVYYETPVPVHDTVYIAREIIKYTASKNKHNIKRGILLADTSYLMPGYYGTNTSKVVEISRRLKYGSAFSDDEKYMKYLTIVN